MDIHRHTKEEVDMSTHVQMLDKTVYISHSPNTFGKDMNQTILFPAMGNLLGRLGF